MARVNVTTFVTVKTAAKPTENTTVLGNGKGNDIGNGKNSGIGNGKNKVTASGYNGNDSGIGIHNAKGNECLRQRTPKATMNATTTKIGCENGIVRRAISAKCA